MTSIDICVGNTRTNVRVVEFKITETAFYAKFASPVILYGLNKHSLYFNTNDSISPWDTKWYFTAAKQSTLFTLLVFKRTLGRDVTRLIPSIFDSKHDATVWFNKG